MAEKPTFILKGRIVTMQSENNIIDDGLMVIKNGHIVKIVTAIDQLPEEFAGNKIIETHGSIYPGMIDLHNHFVYNVLPLWVVPKRYENRSQWPAHEQYKSDVSKPIRLALAKYSVSAKALVRFVEAKALISGTTTGQGMRTKVKGGSKLFQGTMRFVEEPGTTALLPARSMVPNLITTGSTAKERIDSFRSALNDPDSGAYFYHLSEGRDESSRNHFLNLQQYDLINNKLVGIHSLGLRQEDLSHLATIGAKVVWSPFSNQLLYGQTIDLNILKNSGVIFSIGCDWSPSGSKNLLQELKVAYHINEVQGNVFTPFELVAAVTSNAAAVTGWQHHLGTLEEGKLADIIVVKGHQSNPYAHLINTTEKDIELVIIDGIARYGNTLLMNALRVDHSRSLEEINIGNEKKSLYLFNQNSPINDVAFQASMETLKEIMQDLPGFVSRMEQEKTELMGLDLDLTEEFQVELDNEFEIEEDIFQQYIPENLDELMADVPMANSIDFETPTVEGENYWNRIQAQNNISTDLKNWLRACYLK